MTQELARRRMTVAGAALTGALVLFGAALVVSAPRDPAAAGKRSGAVLPGFSQYARQAREITITTQREAYRLVRGDQNWILPERGGYPVRPDRLNALAEGLASLTYDRTMTADAKKLDRLSLGDPTRGGDGIAVRVTGPKGETLADLVLGVRPDGLFLRRSGEVQSYAVEGALPPLREAGAWLDLAIFDLADSSIERADFEPVGGPAFSLRRSQPAASDFTPLGVYAGRRAAAPGGFAAAATPLARIGLIDVRQGSDAFTLVGRHRTVTGDGLVVQTTVFADGARFWARFDASAAAPAAIPQADQINARAQGWLFGLSPQDAALLTTQFNALSPPPTPRPPARVQPSPRTSAAQPPAAPLPDASPL